MDQLDVVRFAVQTCDQLGLTYAVVGSYASSIYGEGRYTQDVDLLIDLQPEQVSEFCNQFSPEEWYVSEEAALNAVRRRRMFNILHSASANKIDVMIPSDTEWGQQQLSRRTLSGLLPDYPVYTAHPEDVILSKLRYYKQGESDKHLRDIIGMLKNSSDLIDRDRVAHWAERLKVLDIWELVLQRHEEAAPSADEGDTEETYDD